MDTIDREAALQAVHKAIAEGKSWYADLSHLPSAEKTASGCEYWDSESDFCSLHRHSAEKTGKWIYDEFKGWCCSECSNQAPFWCLATTQNLTGYCPNCGADMREVD